VCLRVSPENGHFLSLSMGSPIDSRHFILPRQHSASTSIQPIDLLIGINREPLSH
jgi:hypothetical protein